MKVDFTKPYSWRRTLTGDIEPVPAGWFPYWINPIMGRVCGPNGWEVPQEFCRSCSGETEAALIAELNHQHYEMTELHRELDRIRAC